jgi:hypothetical protein
MTHVAGLAVWSVAFEVEQVVEPLLGGVEVGGVVAGRRGRARP